MILVESLIDATEPDQANAMLDLLESINNKLDRIDNNTSKIKSDAYDLGDVCSRIDDVINSMP